MCDPSFLLRKKTPCRCAGSLSSADFDTLLSYASMLSPQKSGTQSSALESGSDSQDEEDNDVWLFGLLLPFSGSVSCVIFYGMVMSQHKDDKTDHWETHSSTHVSFMCSQMCMCALLPPSLPPACRGP